MEKLVVVRGKTVEVNLIDEKTGEVFIGQAHCSPNDTFNYQVGYEIANHRANIQKCADKIETLRNNIARAQEYIKKAKQEEEKLIKEFNCRIDDLALDYDIVD